MFLQLDIDLDNEGVLPLSQQSILELSTINYSLKVFSTFPLSNINKTKSCIRSMGLCNFVDIKSGCIRIKSAAFSPHKYGFLFLIVRDFKSGQSGLNYANNLE